MQTLNLDVIIVTKDRYEKLLQCISSLIKNKVKPANIIIIDSSKDKSIKKINELRKNCLIAKIKLDYYSIKGRGIGYERNRGIQQVKSPFFAFLDDDEYVTSKWVVNSLQIFKDRKDYQILCGPKIPLSKTKYWHRVWASLVAREFDYQGVVDSFPSGNSFYRTSYVRNNKIKFDERFRECSEDLALSYVLKKLKAKIYFDNSLFVQHDIRASFAGITKQWFFYGKNREKYNRYYLGSGNVMDYLRYPVTLSNILKIFPYLPQKIDLVTIPGIFYINAVFVVGYLHSFFSLKK